MEKATRRIGVSEQTEVLIKKLAKSHKLRRSDLVGLCVKYFDNRSITYKNDAISDYFTPDIKKQ